MISKEYLPSSIAKKFPAGPDIYYECLVCGENVSSMPKHSIACKCRNIIVDVDAGRLAVKNLESFEAYVASQENSRKIS